MYFQETASLKGAKETIIAEHEVEIKTMKEKHSHELTALHQEVEELKKVTHTKINCHILIYMAIAYHMAQYCNF